MITIANRFLSVSVNPVGAELSGIRSLDDDHEYMWQGDPSVWTGRSPLLFPFVGKLKNDSYRFGGRSFSMPKHGFARTETFAVSDLSESSVSLRLDCWEKYFESYPFKWSLTVTFSLDGPRLIVCHTVENLGDGRMFFSIGAHPGFNTHEGAYLEFPLPETAQAQRFGDDKIIQSMRQPFLSGGTKFPLAPDTFAADAFVLEGLRSPYLRVVDPAAGRSVRVSFGKAPFLGLWAKPRAYYVCVEPWCGLDDDVFQSGELTDKKGIVSLPASKAFSFSFDIEPFDHV